MTPKVIWKEVSSEDVSFRELNHGDSIKIPLFSPITKKTLTVTLDGAVKKPGKYSFVEGTTLHQIIDEAGGYTKDAYPYGASLFRKKVARFRKRHLKKPMPI